MTARRWGTGDTAIVGVGSSAVTRSPAVGIGALAVEAATDAIADANLSRDDIDGYVGFPRSPSVAADHFDGADEVSAHYLVSALGLSRPRWTMDASGMALGMVATARGGLMSGMCDIVLGVRVLYHQRSRRYSHATRRDEGGVGQFTRPYGLGPGGGRHAMWWNRYMHDHGATREDLYRIVALAHDNASRNPVAVWRDSDLTEETYLGSRWIAEPFCLYDCDMPVAGAAAFVMTTTERAKELRDRVATITAMSNNYNARDVFAASGLAPADIRCAQLYDGFSSFPYYWLEELGFAERGKSPAFVRDGALRPDGVLPTNTFGGSLGEGRLHGIGHVREAALQVMGRAGPRQIDGAEHVLVQVGVGERSWIAILSAS